MKGLGKGNRSKLQESKGGNYLIFNSRSKEGLVSISNTVYFSNNAIKSTNNSDDLSEVKEVNYAGNESIEVVIMAGRGSARGYQEDKFEIDVDDMDEVVEFLINNGNVNSDLLENNKGLEFKMKRLGKGNRRLESYEDEGFLGPINPVAESLEITVEGDLAVVIVDGEEVEAVKIEEGDDLVQVVEEIKIDYLEGKRGKKNDSRW